MVVDWCEEAPRSSFLTLGVPRIRARCFPFANELLDKQNHQVFGHARLVVLPCRR